VEIFAGKVVEVGASVNKIVIGDEVYGQANAVEKVHLQNTQPLMQINLLKNLDQLILIKQQPYL